MYQRDDEPIETVHLYVVPEQEYFVESRAINIGRIINSILCCAFLPLLLVIPSWQNVGPWDITVPLQLLPLQQFTATGTVEQTGTRVVPATNASGTLTVYNGSFLVQQLPKGFVIESTGGAIIVTDSTVKIPAGDPPDYGMARVQAHAIAAGQAGNIRALALSSVIGGSLYIKNLTAFTGGIDARTEQYATEQDEQAALSSARYRLKQQTKQDSALLMQQCDETAASARLSLTVTWQCQFARYDVPQGLHVLSVQPDGDSVRLEVRR